MFFQNFKAVVTIGFFSELFFNFLVFSEFQRSGHKADLMSYGGGRASVFPFFRISTQWSQSRPNVAPEPAFAKTLSPPLIFLFFFFNAVGTKWT